MALGLRWLRSWCWNSRENCACKISTIITSRLVRPNNESSEISFMDRLCVIQTNLNPTYASREISV